MNTPTTELQAEPSLESWPFLNDDLRSARSVATGRITAPLFRSAMSRLHVSITEGKRAYGKGGPAMYIHRPDEFFVRLGRDGLIGFGESYMSGSWDAPDLGGFLEVLAAELTNLVPKPLQKLRALYVHRPPAAQVSSTQNSQANIEHHYDLSNELFSQFLDATMSYSSAIFDGEDDRDLEAAQARKIERLLDEARVQPGTCLLEIGTGWGELALRAAKRGAQVHSITLSSEQLQLARARVNEAGYADQVTIELMDYRDLSGRAECYDAVVSVEMIEAVGYDYWDTYFAVVNEVLKPGGRFALQAITMPHQQMLRTRRTHTWISKYIFPGGFLPSVEVIRRITREQTALALRHQFSFGTDYAKTLGLWDEAFTRSSAQVRALGFDEVFARMWHLYLDYCRAGFAAGYIDVQQFTFDKLGVQPRRFRPRLKGGLGPNGNAR